MSLTRSILTILLIAFGAILFVLSIWIFVTSPNAAFMAFLIGSSGLILGYIGWLLRTSTSSQSFIRSLLTTGLIVFGIGLIVLTLFSTVISSPITPLISGFMGLAVGVGGWLLQKPKKPMSLIRNISRSILLTIGLGIFVSPILILTLYGTNTTYVNIALMHFIIGLIIGLIGLSARNQRSQ
ncbi:hypothetical protein [Pseudanabaena sp. BC1403]|uniref:hypothetical protein n=1 Tax=Pseudanabaena sp. BC1403 TaxID=2043171 RepID=UPI000CD9BE45|nr:hypothetical protein [Pseudanabaena sp. BC1403]